MLRLRLLMSRRDHDVRMLLLLLHRRLLLLLRLRLLVLRMVRLGV